MFMEIVKLGENYLNMACNLKIRFLSQLLFLEILNGCFFVLGYKKAITFQPHLHANGASVKLRREKCELAARPPGRPSFIL